MKTLPKPVTLILGIITAIIILLLSQEAAAQADRTDELMYKAYVSIESNPDPWKAAVKTRQLEYANSAKDKFVGLRLAVAQSGLLSFTMRTKNEDLFDDYYNLQVRLLENLIEGDSKWAEPRALLSDVYGLKMGYSSWQGIFLGPKSGTLLTQARELGPSSALIWKIYANSKLFTPARWGGDVGMAISAYEKAIALFEAQPLMLKYNWLYLDTLAFYGQACLKNGDTGKAIAAYEKALRVEPDFGWVKYELLPKAKTKAQR